MIGSGGSSANCGEMGISRRSRNVHRASTGGTWHNSTESVGQHATICQNERSKRVDCQEACCRQFETRKCRGRFHRLQFGSTRICGGLSNFGEFENPRTAFGGFDRRASLVVGLSQWAFKDGHSFCNLEMCRFAITGVRWDNAGSRNDVMFLPGVVTQRIVPWVGSQPSPRSEVTAPLRERK